MSNLQRLTPVIVGDEAAMQTNSEGNFVSLYQACRLEAIIKELKEANSQLAAAAIEKPPMKSDLVARITELESSIGSLKSYVDCWERLGKEVCDGMTGLGEKNPKDTYNKLKVLLDAVG